MALKINQRTAYQIVDTVKDVCGHDINFIDLDGKIYASTDKSRVGQYHEIGRHVALTADTIEVSDDNSFYGTHAGVNIPIQHQGELIAVIGISGHPDEVRKYAYLAQKITLLILREHELDSEAHVHKNKVNYVIRSLIDKEQAESPRFRHTIEESGIDRSKAYQVVLIKLDNRYNFNNLAMIETTIFQTFQFAEAALYTFNYPNEYIAIIESGKLKNRGYLFDKLGQEHVKLFKIAIGQAYGVDKQYLSYAEAKTACKSERDVPVIYYEQLGLEMLCAEVSKEAAQMFCDKFLKDVTPEEMVLLKTYYKEDMSLARTSEALFLHKNTIQYQLDRIYRKTGYNPREFRSAAGFYAAVLLCCVRE